jgi:hypothetical protein
MKLCIFWVDFLFSSICKNSDTWKNLKSVATVEWKITKRKKKPLTHLICFHKYYIKRRITSVIKDTLKSPSSLNNGVFIFFIRLYQCFFFVIAFATLVMYQFCLMKDAIKNCKDALKPLDCLKAIPALHDCFAAKH